LTQLVEETSLNAQRRRCPIEENPLFGPFELLPKVISYKMNVFYQLRCASMEWNASCLTL
jgi:hypothetical protein